MISCLNSSIYRYRYRYRYSHSLGTRLGKSAHWQALEKPVHSRHSTQIRQYSDVHVCCVAGHSRVSSFWLWRRIVYISVTGTLAFINNQNLEI